MKQQKAQFRETIRTNSNYSGDILIQGNRTNTNQKQQSWGDVQDFQLKMTKIRKQIDSLNLEIKYMVQQKNLSQNMQRTLLGQRNNLQSCFLFKNLKKSMQTIISENYEVQNPSEKGLFRNKIRDVNQRILQYTQQLKSQACGSQLNYQQIKKSDNQNSSKLLCQSLHLKQIFDPQIQVNRSERVSKLKQKLFLLYEKVKLNLQKQEPYLFEKIFQRIKRQAQKQTKLKLLAEIEKLIRQNSKWIKQQTNMLDNQLQEKKIEEVIVSNLGLMKKIMSKKVNNNDYIYENYENNHNTNSTMFNTFSTSKIQERYNQILKLIQQNRISQQLSLFRQKSSRQKQQIQRQSLKKTLQNRQLQKFIHNEDQEINELLKTQNKMLQKVQVINERIRQLLK